MKRNTLRIHHLSHHHHVEPRRGTSFTTITMMRSPAESSLNPRPLIHVNDVDDEIHDYDREGKKERKMNEKKEEGYPRNKVANRSNLFFPTPPPSTTEFLLLSCSEARPLSRRSFENFEIFPR